MTAESPATRRVETYLDDLARMLNGVDPALRVEVLAGVREHIDAALAGRPGPIGERDVEAVLGELGPPQDVAAASLEASAGANDVDRQHRAAGGGEAAASARPALSGRWVPPMVGLVYLAIAGIYLLLNALFLGAADGLLRQQTPAAESGASSVMLGVYDVVWASVGLLQLVGLPWLAATVVLASSALWTPRQKWTGALLVPVVVGGGLLALVAAAELTGSDVASQPVLRLALVLPWLAGVVATIVVVARLWRSGSRRAGAMAA